MKRPRHNAKTLDIDCAQKMNYLVMCVVALVDNVTIMVFGHQLKSKVYIFFDFWEFCNVLYNNRTFNQIP